MTQAHTVEIAIDTPDAEAFAAWLVAQGHSAKVGRTTGNYVDGIRTGSDEEASDILRALWDQFCATC